MKMKKEELKLLKKYFDKQLECQKNILKIINKEIQKEEEKEAIEACGWIEEILNLKK